MGGGTAVIIQLKEWAAAGMGGMGDTMGELQEAMKNPKVREREAQSNPKKS
jgi:hypothetical protein